MKQNPSCINVDDDVMKNVDTFKHSLTQWSQNENLKIQQQLYINIIYKYNTMYKIIIYINLIQFIL